MALHSWLWRRARAWCHRCLRVFSPVLLEMRGRFVEKPQMWPSGSTRSFRTVSPVSHQPYWITQHANLLIRYRVERLGIKFKVRFNEHAPWRVT